MFPLSELDKFKTLEVAIVSALKNMGLHIQIDAGYIRSLREHIENVQKSVEKQINAIIQTPATDEKVLALEPMDEHKEETTAVDAHLVHKAEKLCICEDGEPVFHVVIIRVADTDKAELIQLDIVDKK